MARELVLVILIFIWYNEAIFLIYSTQGDAIWDCQKKLKESDKDVFFTQQDFAKELQVGFSTVNRWEGGKAKPNLIAMKNIKEFCHKNNIDYAGVEEAWLNFKVGGNE